MPHDRTRSKRASPMRLALAVKSPPFVPAARDGEATPTRVSREDVVSLMESGAQLVEVLSAAQYADAHLPGAVHLPLADIDAARAAVLRHEQPIVVYCYDDQ